MLHGPCGADKPNAPCMKDGRCSKHYPKVFNEHTIYGDNGYPQYARPNNGRTVEKNNHIYNNQNVIPYHLRSSARFVLFFLREKKITNIFVLDTIVISMSKYAPLLILADISQNMSLKAMIAPQSLLRRTKIVMRSRSTSMHAISDPQKVVGICLNFLCMPKPQQFIVFRSIWKTVS